MDYLESLRAEHSKAMTMEIVHHIGRDPTRFAQIVDIIVRGQQADAQRASWVISHCAQAEPELIRPFLGQLLENLRHPGHHEAVRRNTLRVTQELAPLNEDVQGIAAELAFATLSDPHSPAAAKAYAMTILADLCQAEPELTSEVRLIIEDQMASPLATGAIRARGRMLLKTMK